VGSWLEENVMNVRLIGTAPTMMRHFNSGPSTIPCTGEDGCPVCQSFGEPKKKMVFNVVDKQDGKVKQTVMGEKQFNKMIGKVMPKGRCFSVRLGKFEVRFWTMWWKLSWRDSRKGSTADCRFWMYGPWEFKRYW
jgi:hypothetical protein